MSSSPFVSQPPIVRALLFEQLDGVVDTDFPPDLVDEIETWDDLAYFVGRKARPS